MTKYLNKIYCKIFLKREPYQWNMFWCKVSFSYDGRSLEMNRLFRYCPENDVLQYSNKKGTWKTYDNNYRHIVKNDIDRIREEYEDSLLQKNRNKNINKILNL